MLAFGFVLYGLPTLATAGLLVFIGVAVVVDAVAATAWLRCN